MKKNLNPITFETRVQIHKLSQELPKVPFFIMMDGKAVIQQITKTKLISYNFTGCKVEKGKETRLMNHKVNLNKQYQLFGQQGIDEYVYYVMDLDTQLGKLQEKVEQATEDAIRTEKIREEDVIKKLPIPDPAEFGYIYDTLIEAHIWSIEGGEQAYHSAMSDYQKQQEWINEKKNHITPDNILEELPKEDNLTI